MPAVPLVHLRGRIPCRAGRIACKGLLTSLIFFFFWRKSLAKCAQEALFYFLLEVQYVLWAKETGGTELVILIGYLELLILRVRALWKIMPFSLDADAVID